MFFSIFESMSPKSVFKSIKQEHEMCTSYVNARYWYLDTVVSFLEPHAGLVHSCHFGLRQEPFVWAVFIMLVTYTKPGVRLSCSEFELARFPLTIRFDDDFRIIVQKHHQVGHLTRNSFGTEGRSHIRALCRRKKLRRTVKRFMP